VIITTFSKAVTDILEIFGGFSMPSLLQQLALLSTVAKVSQN
jgi:hypothetical protein